MVNHIYSPDWTKNIKTTIKSINKQDKKCCQCAVTVALNYEKIKKHPQGTKKLTFDK